MWDQGSQRTRHSAIPSFGKHIMLRKNFKFTATPTTTSVRSKTPCPQTALKLSNTTTYVLHVPPALLPNRLSIVSRFAYEGSGSQAHIDLISPLARRSLGWRSLRRACVSAFLRVLKQVRGDKRLGESRSDAHVNEKTITSKTPGPWTSTSQSKRDS